MAVVATALLAGPALAQADGIGFSKPTYVSTTLAGGEPLVFADTKHGTLIYASHEGTTHLYRNGLATIPVNWLANYRNQVNTWYSTDNGKTWTSRGRRRSRRAPASWAGPAQDRASATRT